MESLAELEEGLEAGVERVLLDHMSLDDMREGTRRAHAAGATTEAREEIAGRRKGGGRDGVDFISVGVLQLARRSTCRSCWSHSHGSPGGLGSRKRRAKLLGIDFEAANTRRTRPCSSAISPSNRCSVPIRRSPRAVAAWSARSSARLVAGGTWAGPPAGGGAECPPPPRRPRAPRHGRRDRGLDRFPIQAEASERQRGRCAGSMGHGHQQVPRVHGRVARLAGQRRRLGHCRPCLFREPLEHQVFLLLRSRPSAFSRRAASRPLARDADHVRDLAQPPSGTNRLLHVSSSSVSASRCSSRPAVRAPAGPGPGRSGRSLMRTLVVKLRDVNTRLRYPGASVGVPTPASISKPREVEKCRSRPNPSRESRH